MKKDRTYLIVYSDNPTKSLMDFPYEENSIYANGDGKTFGAIVLWNNELSDKQKSFLYNNFEHSIKRWEIRYNQ